MTNQSRLINIINDRDFFNTLSFSEKADIYKDLSLLYHSNRRWLGELYFDLPFRPIFCAELDKNTPGGVLVKNLKLVKNYNPKPKDWVNNFTKNKKKQNTLTDHLWLSTDTPRSQEAIKKIFKRVVKKFEFVEYYNDLGNYVILFTGEIYPYKTGGIQKWGVSIEHARGLFSKRDKKVYLF